MAIGVPETEVFAAADAVLARGERPTVERVRLQLGRGSPARIGQLLEQWWEHLAKRLKGHTLLPELPGDVAQAFTLTWQLAVEQAQTTARQELTAAQNALLADQTSLIQERKLWEIGLTEAQGQAAAAASEVARLTLQLEERHALRLQLEAQCQYLLQERDRQHAEAAQHLATLDALRDEHTQQQAQIRHLEDRAHRLVDEARQQVKGAEQRFDRAQQEHRKAVTQLAAERDQAREKSRAAEQALAHQSGRMEALEASVNALSIAKTAVTKAARSRKAMPRKKAKKTKAVLD